MKSGTVKKGSARGLIISCLAESSFSNQESTPGDVPLVSEMAGWSTEV